MVKFILQFSCWKTGPLEYLVVMSCAKTHEVRAYVGLDDGSYLVIDLLRPMPDVRLAVPCKWHALSARLRSRLRSAFLEILEAKYGDDNSPSHYACCEPIKCD